MDGDTGALRGEVSCWRSHRKGWAGGLNAGPSPTSTPHQAILREDACPSRLVSPGGQVGSPAKALMVAGDGLQGVAFE